MHSKNYFELSLAHLHIFVSYTCHIYVQRKKYLELFFFFIRICEKKYQYLIFNAVQIEDDIITKKSYQFPKKFRFLKI